MDDGSLSDAQRRARKVKPQLGEGPLVKVAWARNQAEAELIAGLLLEQGVPSVVRRNSGFDVPDFLAAGPRDVLVPESGLQVARDALNANGVSPAPLATGGPTLTTALGILAGVLVAAGITALVAWALLQLAG